MQRRETYQASEVNLGDDADFIACKMATKAAFFYGLAAGVGAYYIT